MSASNGPGPSRCVWGARMGEVVNLRQARKKKARAEKEARPLKTRTLHGRTKGERREEADKAKAAKTLDEQRIDPEAD